MKRWRDGKCDDGDDEKGWDLVMVVEVIHIKFLIYLLRDILNSVLVR